MVLSVSALSHASVTPNFKYGKLLNACNFTCQLNVDVLYIDLVTTLEVSTDKSRNARSEYMYVLTCLLHSYNVYICTCIIRVKS